MTESAGHDIRLQALLRLRVLVAYLGERPQYNWWSSMFMGVDFRAILTPVFHPMLTPPFGA